MGAVRCWGWVGQQVVDLSCDVSFEAADASQLGEGNGEYPDRLGPNSRSVVKFVLAQMPRPALRAHPLPKGRITLWPYSFIYPLSTRPLPAHPEEVAPLDWAAWRVAESRLRTLCI